MQAGHSKCRCCGGQQPVFVHRESGPCPSPHPPTSGSAPTRMCVMCTFRPPVTLFSYFKCGNLTLLHSRTIGNPIKRFFDVVRNKTPWHWKQSRSVEGVGARACQRPVTESLDTGCFSCRLLELHFWGRALALLKAVFLWRKLCYTFPSLPPHLIQSILNPLQKLAAEKPQCDSANMYWASLVCHLRTKC